MFRKKYDFYIAGKMRGCKDLNKPMFNMVSKILRDDGFTVWNPAEHDSYLKKSFAQVMTLDLNHVINTCNKIAFLPGWRASLGANIEAFCAFATGKEAIRVLPNEDHTTVELIPFDLSDYVLPYNKGITHKFNPHKCELDSFSENV